MKKKLIRHIIDDLESSSDGFDDSDKEQFFFNERVKNVCSVNFSRL